MKKFPDAELLIIGHYDFDRAYKQEIDLYITDVGLENNVRFLNYTDKIAQHFAAAQVHVLSSEFEGCGLVTQEAKAHAVPTVAFSMRYLDSMKKGVIQVEKKNYEQMADAIIRIFEDPVFGT